MLVLSRKKNEAIIINQDIKIVIVEIRGDKCRVGIEAPKSVPVHREEVWMQIHREDVAPEGQTGEEQSGGQSEASDPPVPNITKGNAA